MTSLVERLRAELAETEPGTAESLALCNALVALEPENSAHWFEKGVSERNAPDNRTDEAIQSFVRVSLLDSTDVSGFDNAAVLAKEEGRHALAASLFECAYWILQASLRSETADVDELYAEDAELHQSMLSYRAAAMYDCAGRTGRARHLCLLSLQHEESSDALALLQALEAEPTA